MFAFDWRYIHFCVLLLGKPFQCVLFETIRHRNKQISVTAHTSQITRITYLLLLCVLPMLRVQFDRPHKLMQENAREK